MTEQNCSLFVACVTEKVVVCSVSAVKKSFQIAPFKMCLSSQYNLLSNFFPIQLISYINL